MADEVPGVDAALAEAESLLVLHRPDEAAAVLGRAIAGRPDDPRLRCLFSQAKLESGDYDASLRAASDAAALAPGDEWPLRLRASALSAKGLKKEAVTAAREAVRAAPDEPLTHVVLCDTLLGVKDRSGAAEAAETVRRLAPNSDLAHLALGSVAISRKRWREAEEQYMEVLRIDPNDSAALNNLGVALKAQGRTKEAVHFFAASAKQDPRDPTAKQNAISAVGVGYSVVVIATIQIGRVVFNGLEGAAAGIGYAALAAVWLMIIGFGFRSWRRRRRNPLPEASKELLKTLRKQARGEQGLKDRRLIWLAVGVSLAGGSLVALTAAAVAASLADIGDAAASAALAVVCGALGVLALRRRRRLGAWP